MAAAAKINNDLKEIQSKNTAIEGVLAELIDKANVFEWRIWLQGPHDTAYEKGIFKVKLTFPDTYPLNPPEMVFESQFWHPNVYENGKVCISILHPPGHDEMSGERREERWLPSHTPVTIMLSVLSMLGEPNISSPANVDASVMFRTKSKEFEEKVATLAEKAMSELPDGVKERIPHPDTDPTQKAERIAWTRKLVNPDEDLFGPPTEEVGGEDDNPLMTFDDDDEGGGGDDTCYDYDDAAIVEDD